MEFCDDSSHLGSNQNFGMCTLLQEQSEKNSKTNLTLFTLPFHSLENCNYVEFIPLSFLHHNVSSRLCAVAQPPARAPK